MTQRENECSWLAVDGQRTNDGVLCTLQAVLSATWQTVAV